MPDDSISISGDLSIQTAAGWQAGLVEAVRSNSALIVDLSAVTTCDAAGIQLLCSLRASAPDARMTSVPAVVRNAAEELGIPLDSWAREL